MKKKTIRVVPDNKKVCQGRALAATLAASQLPADEAKAWHRDLQRARKKLKTPLHRYGQ
jgi:hypothetical protein